jgi:Rad3-related DNA helicase
MLDYPHTFPTENRLVVHVPTVRMNHKTDRDGLKLWLSRIDQIIDKHITQNGIIHTVSYARRNMVTERSRHRERMLTHGSRDAEAAVARFKRDGGILVSPSVATGYDFPGDQARWQIIGKLPYPDTRNRLVAARCRADTDYAAYVAMMEMVQASGRIVRSEDDWGLTIVIDNNVDDWFMRQYGWLAPKWFREAYRRSVVIP